MLIILNKTKTHKLGIELNINLQLKNELEELKEKYKRGEEFLIIKEKEFLDFILKKDNKLMELEKSLKIVSDEYEYEIIKLNKILKDKEEEFIGKINKKSSEKIDYEKELAEADLIIQELQSKCEFHKGKNNEYDQFCKDYDCKIQSLENQIHNLNEIIINKEKIIFEYEENNKNNNNCNFDYATNNNVNNESRFGYNREVNNNHSNNNFSSTTNSHFNVNDCNSNFSNKTLNAYNSGHSEMNFKIRDETEIIFLKNQIKEKG